MFAFPLFTYAENSIAIQDENLKDSILVNLALRNASMENTVGAFHKFDVKSYENIDHRVWTSDILTGRAVGLLGANNIRGLGIGLEVSRELGTGSGNAMIIVDGLPRDITHLRISEIESITILKDVNSCVLYGPAALNGVILVTTKRGNINKKKINVSGNFGIQSPLALPKYLNSADYLTWYNQARVNDGMAPLYDDETIEKYRSGNKYRYPDVDYYSDEYLRKFKNYYDINAEFSGGNQAAQYYINAGWYSSGNLIDFGEWSKARSNTLNIRTNIDLKINDWIKTSNDGSAVFETSRNGRGNYWSIASSYKPNLFSPLLPIELINPDNELLKSNRNIIDGKFILGGNSSYPYTSNAFALGFCGGSYEGVTRKYTFNNRIDFDLSNLTEGLSFHTNMNFDYTNWYVQTIYNSLSVYEPSWVMVEGQEKIISLKQHGVDSKPGTQSIENPYFKRRMGFYAQLDYKRLFNERHYLSGNLIAYANQYKFRNSSTSQSKFSEYEHQGVKQSHLGIQLGYTYENKYLADFSCIYAHSTKLAPRHNNAFSPTFGIAWLMSNESFMKNINFLNFLKIRLTGGILKSDASITNYFLYEDLYSGSGTYYWNEGASNNVGQIGSRGANPNLGFENRKEINFGIDSKMFSNTLSLEANLFYENYGGQVVRTNTLWPGFYSGYVPYENYESDSYRGAELGLRYNNTWGDFNFMIGANLLYVKSNREAVSEFYDYDYLYRKGHPRDGTWALEALGLFQNKEEIEASPVQSYGIVRPGDIKYKDQNGDNIIDDNDQVYVGCWRPPFSTGLEITIGYKGLSLYILGNGMFGKDYKGFMEGNYYWLDGTKKYSEIAFDTWTKETAGTATFPALSTANNNNNDRRSTFWMYDKNFFQIRKIQLSYSIPSKLLSPLHVSSMSFFIDSSNPWQFAAARKIMELRTGGEPYYRNFSFGVRASF